jgi:hypothetical protein
MLRKKLFYLCLSANDVSMRQFAVSIGCTPTWLCDNLSGKVKLNEKIRKVVDEYIANNLHCIKDLLRQYELAA